MTQEEKVLYKKLQRLVLSEHQMKINDYPRKDPVNPEKIKLYGDHFGYQKGNCKRCKIPFDTSYLTPDTCHFHYGKSWKERGSWKPWTCCYRAHSAQGCVTKPYHVHLNNVYFEPDGFKQTPQPGRDKEEFSHGIFALDTESICTKRGLEVCRVSVINWKKERVYETFLQPRGEILDYNTWWSGIEEKQLRGVTKTFDQMQADMMGLINSKTILIGHGLYNDLVEMKLLHDNVIDTSVLYPHPRGHPRKLSLQQLALDHLGRNIQAGGAAGHDSREDAEICMELVLRKAGRF